MIYPLLFAFKDAVSGQSFLAGVAIDGRALMVAEDDGKWWMYGVTPGGLAACGTTPTEAHAAFRDIYRKVLFDIAAFSSDYEGFRREVESFYAEPDEEDGARWAKAARAIRDGEVEPDAPFRDLPRIRAEEHHSKLVVERLDQASRRFSPTDNVVDTIAVAAEAA